MPAGRPTGESNPTASTIAGGGTPAVGLKRSVAARRWSSSSGGRAATIRWALPGVPSSAAARGE